MRVASQVAERLKVQDLRNQISNLEGHITQCLVFLQELKLCEQHTKTDIKLFFSCQRLLDYCILFQIFFLGLQLFILHRDNSMSREQSNQFNFMLHAQVLSPQDIQNSCLASLQKAYPSCHSASQLYKYKIERNQP